MRFYYGLDLHARSMLLCIMEQSGEVLFRRNYRANPDSLLSAIALYREDIAVAVECVFTTIEQQINARVSEHDPVAVHLLRSIPGVGKTLALVILFRYLQHQSLSRGLPRDDAHHFVFFPVFNIPVHDPEHDFTCGSEDACDHIFPARFTRLTSEASKIK
jgi:hypothetical protein